MIKRLWNRTFPYYRLCGRRWCLRVQTYDYRCHLHQDGNQPNVQVFGPDGEPVEPRPEHYALAGFCKHGVGMLNQCDDCCPPVEQVTR